MIQASARVAEAPTLFVLVAQCVREIEQEGVVVLKHLNTYAWNANCSTNRLRGMRCYLEYKAGGMTTNE